MKIKKTSYFDAVYYFVNNFQKKISFFSCWASLRFAPDTVFYQCDNI